MCREWFDIGPSLTQGRDFDGHNPQTVEEVFTEASFLNRASQVEVGGGNDPRVGRTRLALTHRLERLLLENAEELHLKVKRRVSRLVQEQRSPRGEVEPSDPLADRASEGSAHMPEEFGLQKFTGQRAAIHGDERAAAAWRMGVDRSGENLLPRAALTRQENGGLALLEILDQSQDALHRGRAPDEAGEW